MSCKPIVLTLALFLGLSSAAASADLFVEETGLTGEESELFQRIASVDPTFHYSGNVRRYYRLHPETKNKLPVAYELVFRAKDGIYFDEFVSYTVQFDPDTGTVNYAFDAGTAYRGNGTIMVTPAAVIKIERSCGVTDCSTEITRDGKTVWSD